MIRLFDPRGLVVPIALVLAAEAAARLSNLQSDTLAAPSAIIVAGIESLADGSLLVATAETLACAAAGLAIGFFAGAALGIVTGLFRPLDRMLEVTIEVLRPIPPVALIPIALLVYGFGYRMEIAIGAFATAWPALIFTRAAIAGVEPRLFEVAEALQLGFLARIWKIVIPAALPRLFVAMRLAIAIALIVSVTVEVTSNTLGLGHTMMEAQQSLHPQTMLAFLVWTGFLGWGLNALLLAVQRRLFGAMGGVAA